MAKEKFGEFMVRKGYITPEQLEAALTHQRRMGGRLGTVIWRLKMMDERLLLRALGEYFGCPFTLLRGKRVSREALNLIDADTARRLKVLPLKFEDRDGGKRLLYLAMRNPKDTTAVEYVKSVASCDVRPVVVLDPDLEEAIEMSYSEELAHRPEPLQLDEGIMPSAPARVFYMDESELEPHDLDSRAREKLMDDDSVSLRLDPNIDTKVYLTFLIKLLIKRGVLSKDDFKGVILED